MKMVLEILTGSLFYVEVAEDASLKDLKKAIESQEKLPADRLILMLDNNVGDRFLMRQDQVLLKEYGVADGSHIYIFFEPLDSVDALPDSPKFQQDSAFNLPTSTDEIVPNQPENKGNEEGDETMEEKEMDDKEEESLSVDSNFDYESDDVTEVIKISDDE